MHRIVAIDPGTRNTGVVLMDEYGVSDATLIHFQQACQNDPEALRRRCYDVAYRLQEVIFRYGPVEAVVVEGFEPFPHDCRANASTFQTPYLVGYLQRMLEGDNLVIQLSAHVFGTKTPGSFCFGARTKDEVKYLKARAVQAIKGSEKLTNDHTRSAALHGAYYLRRFRRSK